MQGSWHSGKPDNPLIEREHPNTAKFCLNWLSTNVLSEKIFQGIIKCLISIISKSENLTKKLGILVYV